MKRQTFSCRTAAIVLVCLTAAGCDVFTSPETRIARAEKLMAASDYSGALIELKNVLQKDPNNARAHLDMAQVILQLGDPSHAEQELKRALEHGLSPADAAQTDARVRLAMGKSAELLADIDSGKLALPEPSRSTYRGQALLSLGRFAEAADVFNTVLGQNTPQNDAQNSQLTTARIGLAQAYAGQRKPDRALAELDVVIARKPDAAEAWLVKGTLLALLGRGADAEKALEQAHQHSNQLKVEQQARLLAALTDAKLRHGDLKGAEELHASLAKLSDSAPVTRILAARIAMARKDYTGAAAELQRLLKDTPDFIPARVLLAEVLLAQGNPQQAELQLSQAVQKAPDNPALRQMLAKVHKQLGRPDPEESAATSVEEKEALARKQARRPDPRLAQAETYMRAGQKDKAIAEYERLLASNPQNPGVLNNLAWLYHETGDSRALATAQKAHKLAPKAPEISDTYGWILVKAGRVDEGLKLLQAAAAASDNPEIHKHYAEAQSLLK